MPPFSSTPNCGQPLAAEPSFAFTEPVALRILTGGFATPKLETKGDNFAMASGKALNCTRLECAPNAIEQRAYTRCNISPGIDRVRMMSEV